MPKINRLPDNSDNDDEHYETLVNRQAENKKYDNARNYDLFSIGSTGYIITRNRKHIKTTPITAEQYLRD